MGQTGPVQMCSYELPLPADASFPPDSADRGESASLPDPLLIRNVLWFCRFRWIAIGVLVAFGAVAFVPGIFQRFGLRPRVIWPFVVAAILTLTNLRFLAHARLLTRPGAAPGARVNLWAQIILDLLILTAVVHYLGSLETYAAFAYLFHIVLACIFFSRGQSFRVVAIACGLYVTCVALEEAGVLPPASVYADERLRSFMDRTPGVHLLNIVWAIGIWGVVWYLASRLSALVRARDRELAETNRRLVAAQQEKARHMLRTTHELKAPFAAIHANAQLLLGGHCGVLPDEALDVVRRIARRCGRLATEIQEMLQLANLRSSSDDPPPPVDLDLAEIVKWCVGQVRQAAEQRRVAIDEDLEPARTVGVEDHLKMFFTNLLSNAVRYSHEHGRVQVRCTAATQDGPLVTIEDHGIGIVPEKLPRIFDEYYRTDEAAQYNKESTGLGLAIVKHVAESHRIRVRVESMPGVGTTFALRFAGTAGDRPRSQAAGRG